MLHLKINGLPVEAPEGSTILEAAVQNGVNIPTLCYLKDCNMIGACRVCLVEIKGGRGLTASCCMPASEGMEVFTNSEKVRAARKFVVELILSDHERTCLTCPRNRTCELRALAEELGVRDIPYDAPHSHKTVDEVSPSIVRDNNKCILCRRCVAMCEKVQKIGAIGAQNRGYKTEIGSPFRHSLADVNCINCGQCIIGLPHGRAL